MFVVFSCNTKSSDHINTQKKNTINSAEVDCKKFLCNVRCWAEWFIFLMRPWYRKKLLDYSINDYKSI